MTDDTPFFTNGHTLEYVYAAGGNKLRKIVRQNGVILSEQDYVGGLEYRKIASGSRRVESLYHTEGRYYNLNAEMSNTLNWRRSTTSATTWAIPASPLPTKTTTALWT